MAQLFLQVGQARVIPGDQVPDDANQDFPAHLGQCRQHDGSYGQRLVKAAATQDMCRRNQADPPPDRAALKARRPRLPRRGDGAFPDRKAWRREGAVLRAQLNRPRAAFTAWVPRVSSRSVKQCRTASWSPTRHRGCARSLDSRRLSRRPPLTAEPPFHPVPRRDASARRDEKIPSGMVGPSRCRRSSRHRQAIR
jgi:hypothetical protein